MAAATGADDQHTFAFDVDAKVVEPLDEADAVEQRRFERAVRQPPHRIHGAGNLRHRIARLQQRG